MVRFEKSHLLCRCYDVVHLFFLVHVNCLAKKRTDSKKTLKGLCICLIYLEFLFSYNLSAIKRGFFFFIASFSLVSFFVRVCAKLESVEKHLEYSFHVHVFSENHSSLLFRLKMPFEEF